MNIYTSLKKITGNTAVRVGVLSAVVAAVALPLGASASGPARHQRRNSLHGIAEAVLDDP